MGSLQPTIKIEELPFVAGPHGAEQTAGNSLLDETADEDKITYVSPKYVDYVDKSRFWIATVFGVLLAALSLFVDIGSVYVPTLLLVITYETLAFRAKKVRFPKHGYIVNAILAAGFNEDLVINMGKWSPSFLPSLIAPFLAGLLIDIGWEIVIDVLLVTFGFLAFKLTEQTLAAFV
ncbi:hypothetical protein M3Y99_01499600 [Aphelenchoides fujianensis]|nr:hypothetical protein M3Y99_01499600 [Aphelenchoides fujianensis]